MKPVLFHSINLPQQEGLEEKSGWRTMRWTRVFFLQVMTYTRVQLLYKMCRAVRWANARVELEWEEMEEVGESSVGIKLWGGRLFAVIAEV